MCYQANYENATTFDGFRFERERVEHMSQHDPADQDIFKRHMISVAPDHLPFGTGKHACPVSIHTRSGFFFDSAIGFAYT
jgi:cytochrome P450